MLEKLYENGSRMGLFVMMPMKDLKHSCAKDVNTEVIDYDQTKELVFESMNNGTLKFNEMKSCDGLKIMPSIEQIDFIEIKGVKDFCEKLSLIEESETNSDSSSQKIDKQIIKFSLKEKIEQSIDILKFLLQIQAIGISKEEKKIILDTINKNYLIVIDEEIERDESKKLAATMDFLSTTSNYKDQIIVKLKDCIDGIEHMNINRPKLISQSRVDDFYRELLCGA